MQNFTFVAQVMPEVWNWGTQNFGVGPVTPDDPQVKIFYGHTADWAIATIMQNVNFVAQLVLDIDKQVLKIWGGGTMPPGHPQGENFQS